MKSANAWKSCLEIMRKITVASCLVLTHLQKMSQKCHLPQVEEKITNDLKPQILCVYIYIYT